MFLSDIQGQLSVMQEQNACRDETLHVLDRDIKEIKSMKRFSDDSNDVPNSKHWRKSPRGLSVSVH